MAEIASAALGRGAQHRRSAIDAMVRFCVIALMAFLTVVDLFAAQALLPTLVHHYQVSPAQMGLAVNACTVGMAVAGLAVAFFGGRIGRRSGILASLVLLAIPTALLAHAPNLAVFAILRVVQGLFMATAFSLTLAYLGERYDAAKAGAAFAAYITGNVASNLIGRLIAAGVAEHAGLTGAFYTFAALNLLGAALAYAAIPRVRPEPARGMAMGAAMRGWVAHLRHPGLRAGFGIGFCILFAFIGTFTFVNFVLVAPPLSVGMMELGLIYLVFLPSILTTPLAGAATLRLGTRNTLLGSLGAAAAGLPLLLSSRLGFVLVGMILVAVGTFFAQAVATGFVSRTATGDRSAASGIYLASYFIGGLIGTAVLGQMFDWLGWPAAVAGVGAALAVAALLSFHLERAENPRAV
jgi:predicted MFS family arabinose efflux permease